MVVATTTMVVAMLLALVATVTAQAPTTAPTTAPVNRTAPEVVCTAQGVRCALARGPPTDAIEHTLGWLWHLCRRPDGTNQVRAKEHGHG